MVLVVVERLLLLELLVCLLLAFNLDLDIFLLLLDFFAVNFDEVLGDPSVVAPVFSNVMDVVFKFH